MKRTIGREFIFALVIPLLIIISILFAYVIVSIYENAIFSTESKIKSASEIKAATSKSRLEGAKNLVLSTADILSHVNNTDDQARTSCENIILSMFADKYISNVRLAYEPQAFDGKDALHKANDPGAPSGRFIRSYVRVKDEIIAASDVNETVIDDEKECPWYAGARDGGGVYVNVGDNSPNLYDYRIGDSSGYTLSIAAPIKRDGKTIGCVGANIVFDGMNFEIDGFNDVAVAVFYPGGRLLYASGLKYEEEDLDMLNFSSAQRIKEAFANNQALFLVDERSSFSKDKAFSYFSPLYEGLYLYVSVPRNEALKETNMIALIIAAIFLAVLAALLAFAMFVIRRIANPMQDLVLAANAIANGNFEVEIDIISKTENEIGVLSRSLHRIVEQFKVNILLQKNSEEKFAVYSYITQLLQESYTLSAAFHSAAVMLCRNFGFYKSTVVYIYGDRAFVLATYQRDYGFYEIDENNPPNFLCHTQVMKLLPGKNILYMNTHALLLHNMDFILPCTISVCIVPLYLNQKLCGYIILENSDVDGNITAYDESTYTYIANTLSRWMSRGHWELEESLSEKDEKGRKEEGEKKEGREEENKEDVQKIVDNTDGATQEADTPEASGFILSLAGVPGLDAPAAVSNMGGLEEIYESTLRLMIRLLPENVAKMDTYLPVDEDLGAFAIEVHGMKGALNNIGHRKLASYAEKLEKAAKSADKSYCDENYGCFKEQLLDFYNQVKDIIITDNAVEKKEGDINSLFNEIGRAKEAAENFDSIAASEILSPFLDYSFDEKTDDLILQAVNALEEFDCEKALEHISEIEKEYGR